MITKGVLETVSDLDHGFYSHLFLVEKSSGGWRPVTDLTPLNELVQQTPFRMETPNSVLLTVRKNDFLASIDLKDAYFQIPVHPSSRRLLRFVSNDTVYQFKSLMFRTDDRPANVHESFCGGFFLGSRSRNLPATIPGRLADLVHLRDQDKTTCRPTPLTLPLPRHSDKHGEVRPLPVQVHRIPRHDCRHGICPSIPHRGPHTEIPLLARKFLAQPSPPARRWQVLLGHMSSLEKLVPCARLDAFPPVASEVPLVHRDRSPTPSGTPVPAGGQGHILARNHLLEGTPFAATPPP